MAILDELLGIGGSDDGSGGGLHNSATVDFGPALGLSADKILDLGAGDGDGSGGLHLTGVEGLALGLEAPLHIGSETSTDGGLLGGLL